MGAMADCEFLQPSCQEAVEAALKHEDIALAKRSACKPPDSEKRLRQKLWLRIVEHQARYPQSTLHTVSRVFQAAKLVNWHSLRAYCL